MPKAFSEHEKKIISQQLLEQGRKHFASFGLRKSRVEELAAAVGISKGAFYIFYESKEALFMEVVEEAERHFRDEVLAMIDLSGSSPSNATHACVAAPLNATQASVAAANARLFAVLHKAFTLWKTIPILQIFTHADYEALARRVPPETMQAHLQSDEVFIEELIVRCQRAGIPMQVQAEQLDGLLHALFFASLHEDDFGSGELAGAIEVLLKLTVAYCLGEVKL